MTRLTRLGFILFLMGCFTKAGLISHYGIELTPESITAYIVSSISVVLGTVLILWNRETAL